MKKNQTISLYRSVKNKQKRYPQDWVDALGHDSSEDTLVKDMGHYSVYEEKTKTGILGSDPTLDIAKIKVVCKRYYVRKNFNKNLLDSPYRRSWGNPHDIQRHFIATKMAALEFAWALENKFFGSAEYKIA